MGLALIHRSAQNSPSAHFALTEFSDVAFVDGACTLYVILRSWVLGGQLMRQRIRPFEDRDTEAVVDFSLRAWAPVFAPLERVLGSEIFRRLHPDWRED